MKNSYWTHLHAHMDMSPVEVCTPAKAGKGAPSGSVGRGSVRGGTFLLAVLRKLTSAMQSTPDVG